MLRFNIVDIAISLNHHLDPEFRQRSTGKNTWGQLNSFQRKKKYFVPSYEITGFDGSHKTYVLKVSPGAPGQACGVLYSGVYIL